MQRSSRSIEGGFVIAPLPSEMWEYGQYGPGPIGQIGHISYWRLPAILYAGHRALLSQDFATPPGRPWTNRKAALANRLSGGH